MHDYHLLIPLAIIGKRLEANLGQVVTSSPRSGAAYNYIISSSLLMLSLGEVTAQLSFTHTPTDYDDNYSYRENGCSVGQNRMY